MNNLLNTINNIVWGKAMIMLLLGTGFYLSLRTGFFQLFKPVTIFKNTVLTLFKKNSNSGDSVSQLQAVCTSLAATMGTGNIVGVAAALILGGAGAIFWMWISALLGMAIVYFENFLGVYFKSNSTSSMIPGPMAYLEKGLNAKWLAVIYAFFCVISSLGMGNMVQVSSICEAAKTSFKIPPLLSGIIIFVLSAVIILTGKNLICKVTEKLIPFLSVMYIIGCILVIVLNAERFIPALKEIFIEAFNIESAVGGTLGTVISVGLRKGVFSNEAGLGSTVLVHTESEEKSPVRQGLFAVTEVFLDTIICCTLTALAILTSGVFHNKKISDSTALVINAFETGFSSFSGAFVSVSIILFAFATLLGWSFFGQKAFSYIFGKKNLIYYKLIYIFSILLGAYIQLDRVFVISEIANGLMAIPNLTGVILLSPVCIAPTNNFFKRSRKPFTI